MTKLGSSQHISYDSIGMHWHPSGSPPLPKYIHRQISVAEIDSTALFQELVSRQTAVYSHLSCSILSYNQQNWLEGSQVDSLRTHSSRFSPGCSYQSKHSSNQCTPLMPPLRTLLRFHKCQPVQLESWLLVERLQGNPKAMNPLI